MTFIKSIGIILIFIISIIEGYNKPLARYGHGSIVLGSNLYFFGGYVKETSGNELLLKNTNDFFYLDLSKPLNRLNPQYIDLTTTSNPPVRFSQGSLIPNNQENGFYLIGGVMNDINDFNKSFYNNFIYEYNEITKEWSIPEIINSPNFLNLKEFNSVYYNENSYIFGGINDNNLKTIPEMKIFNSKSLSWSFASNDVPNLKSFSGYTATLLSNGVIIYIGGKSFNDARNSLSDVYTYDTRNDKWNYMQIDSQGINPDLRNGHTAVLAFDNRIIVYGGVRNDDSTEALPQLIVLDTNDYKWITPSTTKIESRESHTANLIGDYMIISFGAFSSPESDDFSDEIQILDTRTYEWVDWVDSISPETTNTNFITNMMIMQPRGVGTTSTPPKSKDSDSSSFFTKVPKNVQAVIFCLSGLLFITIIFLVYYSIRQKKIKAKSRHLSVLPYTNCGEEAKEEIIYAYVEEDSRDNRGR